MTDNELIALEEANASRWDTFLNAVGGYVSRFGTFVESIPSFILRKDAEINARYFTVQSRGDWASGTSYQYNDIVNAGGIVYVAVVEHVAGTFATDLAAGKWAVYQKQGDIVNTVAFGAVTDGVTDTSAAIAAANSAAGKRPLRFNGLHHVATQTIITAPIEHTLQQIFTYNSNVIIANGEPIRPEWFGIVAGQNWIMNTANKLPASGGKILLLAGVYPHNGHRYGYDDPNSAVGLFRDNVTIQGSGMPWYSGDCKQLLYGTVIQGIFFHFGNCLEFRDFGCDSGYTFLSTTPGFNEGGVPIIIPAVTGEGMLGSFPHNQAKLEDWSRVGLKLHNIRGLSLSPQALTHAIIISEGYRDTVCTGEISGCYGVHGVVIKSTKVKAQHLTGYCNGSEGVIVKSDVQVNSVSSQVQIDSISTSAEGPPRTNPYVNSVGLGMGVQIAPLGLNTALLQIGQIQTYKHRIGFGVAMVPNCVIDNMQIGSIVNSDNTEAGTDLTFLEGTNIIRSHIGSIVNRTSPVGFRMSNSNQSVISGLTIGHLWCVNSTVAGLELSNFACPVIGTYVSESDMAAFLFKDFCRPSIGQTIIQGGTVKRYHDDCAIPVLKNGCGTFGGLEGFDAILSGYGIQLRGNLQPNADQLGTAGGTRDPRVIGTLPFWARPNAPLRLLCAGWPTGGVDSVVHVVIGSDGNVVINEKHAIGYTQNCETLLSLASISYNI